MKTEKTKTTFLPTIEHSKDLPPDFIDTIAGRIYTLQCLDQGANSITVKSIDSSNPFMLLVAEALE